MYKTPFLALAFGVVLLAAGCQPSSPTAPASASVGAQPVATPPVAEPVLEIDLQSPDQAVKTWWRFYDINHAHNVESCLSRHRNNLSGPLKYVAQIAQGDVLRTLIPVTSLCRVSTYARDIQEVKTESETRAVVFANIKDVSPVPDGAEPDENDKKYRANGFRYKYVLEKTSAGWKISQVFQYRESMRNDPWLPVYEPFNKPLYPGFIHTQ